MAKMKKAEKTKWVAALRSGKYKQGKGALRHSDNTYCCLGVAVSAITNRDPRNGQPYIKDGRFGLSHQLQRALGCVNDGNTERQLDIKLRFEQAGFKVPPKTNARGRSSFKQIANWLDKNL